MFTHHQLLAAEEFNPRHLDKMTMAQVKMNGLRLLVVKSTAIPLIRREITAFTREGKTDLWYDLCRVPGMRELIEAIPMHTVLDCEVHAPGLPETSMKTLLRNGDPRVVLTPFAVPYFDGVDMRKESWGSAAKLIQTMGFNTPETIVGKLNTGDVENLLSQARERSIEGWVLKAGHYHGWYKLKPVKTFDAVVTGVIQGEGKHIGRMGALAVGLWDGSDLVPVCNVGTGFTDVERTHVWQNPQSIVGKVVEVVYDSLAANGAPKFPRFKRFRDDKEAKQCSMRQIKP